MRRLRMPPAVWAIPVGAVALHWLYGGGYVNPDAIKTLVWGREIMHAQRPSFWLGSTPHPLSTALGTLLAPLGESGEACLQAVGYLTAAGLVYVTALLALRLFGWAAAVVAAVLMTTRVPLEVAGALGYVDVTFALLVTIALVLELERPRRAGSVLVLLLVAGLVRPEAWLLAGAYALYAGGGEPARTVRLGLVAAAAPALWLSADLALTGDPFYSYTQTRDATPSTGRPTGLAGVLEHGAGTLSHAMHPLVLLAAVVGLALTWRDRQVRLLAFWLAAILVSTAVPVVAGTPLNDRYLLAVMAPLCVLAASGPALALGGYPAPSRLVGAAVTLVLAASAISQVGDFTDTRDRTRAITARRSSARSLVRHGIPCQPLVVPNGRLTAPAAVWLNVDPGTIRDGRRGVPRGSYLWGTPSAMDGIVTIPGRPGAAAHAPSGHVVATAGGWTLSERCSA